MRNSIKWLAALCMTAMTIGFSGCDEDEKGYEGSLDLNLLNLNQARELWDGAESNKSWEISKKDEKLTNISYKLNISLYQETIAQQNATVKLTVDKDSLDKAKTMVPNGGVYTKYADAILLPEEYYLISSDEISLHTGNKKSGSVSVTVYSKMLVDLVQEQKESALFVLPLKIVEPSSYGINEKTDAMMLFITVTYVEPEDPDAYVADKTGVPDDHELDGMKLLWHDEFNGAGGPNKDMWRFETGFVRNEEDQWYKEGNALMDDGALVFEGKKERVKNSNYQSGSSDWKKNREYAEYTSSCIVTTDKYVFKYGRMLVRARIPITQGAWPAIWSTGNWWEWPLGGEIDMMEFYKEKIHANVCWGSGKRWEGSWNSKNYAVSGFTGKDSEWAEKFHIWRMDWDSKYIRIYLDDELLNETDLSTTVNKGDNGAEQGGYQNPYSNDFEGFGQRMMLNLAIGGINGRPINEAAFPLKYYVDYIRIYQVKK